MLDYERELLKVKESTEETVDVFVVMKEGKRVEETIDEHLEGWTNKVYFTPRTSHRSPGRAQQIEGKFSSDRSAVILDISWWNGNSFREILGFLEQEGYDKSRVFAYYLCGDQHPQFTTEYTHKPVCLPAQKMERLLRDYQRR